MAQGPMSSILVTIRITVRIQESEVRNLHSLDYRKSYQRILMKFNGELGCGLSRPHGPQLSIKFHQNPTDYTLVTIRITIRIRKSALDHDPDLGRTATLSTHRTDALQKLFSNSIMLAFGGDL